jgi:hypothetical protein
MKTAGPQASRGFKSHPRRSVKRDRYLLGVSTHVYTWGNNPKRETMKGRRCRVIVHGKKNSCLIEFENGQREIISRYAVRPV